MWIGTKSRHMQLKTKRFDLDQKTRKFATCPLLPDKHLRPPRQVATGATSGDMMAAAVAGPTRRGQATCAAVLAQPRARLRDPLLASSSSPRARVRRRSRTTREPRRSTGRTTTTVGSATASNRLQSAAPPRARPSSWTSSPQSPCQQTGSATTANKRRLSIKFLPCGKPFSFYFFTWEIHNGSITFLHLAFSPVFRILHKNGFEPIRQKTRFFPSKKPESA